MTNLAARYARDIYMATKTKSTTTDKTTRKKSSLRSASDRSASPKTTLTKPQPVDQSEIHLVQGKGSKGKGGDPGGHYWHIHVRETRAGFVFINWIDQKPFGTHASIQIKINTKLQNRGIGRVAYRLACEKSTYDTVFAHMRKSNLASKRAAEAAGFQVVSKDKISQLAMVWKRSSVE
jgi:RimJ/RimL family protein N-acetyltransferase